VRGLDFSGKRVLVTGCASGIGRAAASLLRSLGASVHGLDVRPVDLPLDTFTTLDLRDPAGIETFAQSMDAPVDALLNCAGLAPGRPELDLFRVNFAGTRLLTERLLARMPRGSAVVNVASVGGIAWASNLVLLRDLAATPSFDEAVALFEAQPDQFTRAYSLSKEAIVVWTMIASAKTIARGVRMNAISPGAVATPMLAEIEQSTPTQAIDAMARQIGRRSNPEEQAWPLAFLASDAASYVNGAVLPVDGGFQAAHSLAIGTGAAVGRR
jgi:NAD(P)-dependent dehydrogenase (short-subunit alcohol dehydrogenase family)